MNVYYANSTPVSLGMQGTFAGIRYRVAGRVVLGMEEDGETYYWNEFNLVSIDGKSCTLVFEQSDEGGAWKLFTLFEPQQPLTADVAASKRVGQYLEVDGERFRISLVDESRVYHIEGTAPEGVEIGDVAHYFNAGPENEMIVVSWTGNEVEYYRGRNLTTSDVAVAFGISINRLEYEVAHPVSSNPAQKIFQILAIMAGGFFFIVVVIMVFGLGRSSRSSYQTSYSHVSSVSPPPPPQPPPPPPPPPLMLAATGMLDGVTWSVRMHTVVQIAVVGRYYNRHEYQLVNNDEKTALLVCDSRQSQTNWTFYTPLTPKTPLIPEEAAIKGLGDKIELEGGAATVSRLFQTVVRDTEALEGTSNVVKTIYYGLEAELDELPCMARWNTNGVHFFVGKTFPVVDVKKAFEVK